MANVTGLTKNPDPLSFDDFVDTSSSGPPGVAPEPATLPGQVVTDAEDKGDLFPQADFVAASSGQTSAGSAKPVASISQLADYLINGFWQYNSGIAHHWGSSTITYNINGLTAAEQFLAQSAMQAWHEVANISFVQTFGAANITFTHNGTMTAYETDSYSYSGITIAATINISADWITNDGGAMDGKTGIDSYSYQTYIHEIGHALGLGHQGPYNGSASYFTDALYANDTWQYSVMSYFAQNNYNGTYRYVVTPQMADIYAIQAIYGAATTRTGNNVYGFNSNAGSIYNFSSYSQAPALTIYDSGGNDTLDCSGYSAAQTIDLHAGAFSSVGGLVRNVGIALNVNIENAIGGSANDTLIANDLSCTLTGGAGNDTLTGGAGNDQLAGGVGVDVMTGGGGADNFKFAVGQSSATSGQHDRITDFVTGVDHIDLSAIDAIAATGAHDLFRFLGAAAFDGVAGALIYFYNSTLGLTTLQGDTNGDRIADFAIDLSGYIAIASVDLTGVVPTPVAIEAFGATTFTQFGTYYYLYNGGGTGPSLKTNGAPVTVGQFIGVTPIAAEQTASGYNVAWKYASGLYTVWSTDSNGNFVSNLSGGVVSGSSTVLQDLENTFHQDLNGDGTVGIPTIEMEAFGSTSLIQSGSTYHLFTAGTGPSLKANGAPVTVGQFIGVTPIAAEQTGSGYNVAWKYASGLYTVWRTDSNGNFVSNVTDGVVSGSSTVLQGLENTFHQDLNGDGTIGVPTIGIETFGSTSLIQSGSTYYLFTAGTGPSLKTNGAPVTVGQFIGVTPIAAEQTASGYNVAWKYPNGQYTVWNTDSNGDFVSNLTGGTVSRSSTVLQGLENTFHQDLNGDGTIGIPTIGIETFGSTSLVQSGGTYYLFTAGTGPSLKTNGAPVTVGQFAGVTPIAAEQTANGYNVAWKYASGLYTVWSTDSNGNFASNLTGGVVSGSSAVLQGLENTFHQDLNGDGTIGSPTIGIEALGSTSLVQSGDTYYLFTAGTGPSLKSNGAPVTIGQFASVTPIAAEQTASGYNVAWKYASGLYTVWSTDSNGNFVSNLTGGVVSGSNIALQSLENTFHQDLNGDGGIGIPVGQTGASQNAGITLISASQDEFTFNVHAPQTTISDSNPGSQLALASSGVIDPPGGNATWHDASDVAQLASMFAHLNDFHLL
ncbi:M10 family metallopeptidase C-terminal domain-containing protein [Bradyrhizobium sp. AUGA SZCCT0274]|uniref:M10 family metallopeptidase C-terminal domain-containing protein n=1 Tax=Bradyrhizobium sp. AUGA SZCCT0274 TaxID=2807670 RepID=UPI001BAAEE6F|nr:M10 family metallopeptidase C-terminal domain-containing protein [Bradyrhizobium sp. AUGA SZCCT0274]MBR1244217.1 M10 family metallopeptidase C-terminal domain-containing protein [Bradyrhizobium sp. AUGA SZCCT0274]